MIELSNEMTITITISLIAIIKAIGDTIASQSNVNTAAIKAAKIICSASYLLVILN